MGEAIARFCGLMVSAQRYADEYHSQPRVTVTAKAAKKFAMKCREHLLEHEKSGMVWPERYIRGLCRLRDEAERQRVPPLPGYIDYPESIEWVPEPRGFLPPDSAVFTAIRNAVREAVKYGLLFDQVESRIKALEAACDMMIQYAASTYYAGPVDAKASHTADDHYIGYRVKFAEALDALAPFIEEPPAAASDLPSKQQTNGSSSRVGRPLNDEVLARDLLDGWRAYEPEEGRKTIDRYLAQRPDVRALKTEEARQRKIVSLRTALESARSLRASKARQKRGARG